MGDASAVGSPPTLRHQNGPRWLPGDFKVPKQRHVGTMAGRVDDKVWTSIGSPLGNNFIFNPCGFWGAGGIAKEREKMPESNQLPDMCHHVGDKQTCGRSDLTQV